MDFILDGQKVDTEDFTEASIYLDASFVLALFDKSDFRRPEVARVLDVWADYDKVTLGLSNHTVAEVINRVFQMIVLGCLQTYHENNHKLNQTRNGFQKISPRQKEQLVDLDTARYIYRLAKKQDILKMYKKDVQVNVANLMKIAKEDEEKRKYLDVIYNLAVEKFETFICNMRTELGFKIEFLDSLGDSHYQIAKANMRIMQLDITDSFHLAIAQSNKCDFLVTLDGDFLHNYYPKGSDLRIIKVA